MAADSAEVVPVLHRCVAVCSGVGGNVEIWAKLARAYAKLREEQAAMWCMDAFSPLLCVCGS